MQQGVGHSFPNCLLRILKRMVFHQVNGLVDQSSDSTAQHHAVRVVTL